MNNFFDNQRILDIIWKRKFHFILVGIIAVALSALFSSSTFITPKFKSTARIYPTNIWTLSDESETEQMLEVINSNDIKFKMFDAFRLYDVYNIKKDDPLHLTYILDKYTKNVKASKTEFETVEIKILDEDPNRASDMCDSVIHFFNLKVKEIHAIKNREVADISKNSLDLKHKELDSLISVISKTRKETGILSYNTQVEEVTKGYMAALAANRGNSADTKTIKKMYDNLAENGAKAYYLESRLNSVVSVIDSLQNVYEGAVVEAEKEITYSHVVEYPFPADKKAYPVRWLIVAFTTISAVFLALLLFLVLDYRKE